MNWKRFFKRPIVEKPAHIYVGESDIHGRGVFSERPLQAGELIEKAPLILISSGENEILKQTHLYHYYFVVQHEATPVAIGLGYSSVYNHAGPSNASYAINLRDQLIEIKAIKPIAAGEEITINYNGNAIDTSPVSFPAHDE